MDYFWRAQFRTCLWPCVGRWASGQEAGQPPKEENTTSLHPRPAAGGEPAMPALHWRRGLKQRRKGFFGFCRRECRGHRKGLSIFASSAERGFPSSGPRQQSRGVSVSHQRNDDRHRRFTFGGNATGRIEELGRNDRTHPRILEESSTGRTLPGS